MKEKIKKYINEMVFTIFYLLRQAIFYINASNGYFLVGNLDFFYLYAPVYIWQNIKNKERMFKILRVLCILISYVIIQYIFIENLNVFRSLINIAKIFICYIIFLWSRENIKKYKINTILKASVIGIVFLLLLALIFRGGILWRHSDTINKYTLERLQLLYTEPSELGFHTIILMILIISQLMKNEINKKFSVFALIALSVIIILAQPMGAIVIGGVAIVVLFIDDWIYNRTKLKNYIYSGIIIVTALIAIILIVSQNSLYMRIKDTINGKDSSNNYRISIAYKTAQKMLYDTKGLGVGFGNAELEENVQRYKDIGLVQEGIINSYANVIGEGGFLGIAMVIWAIYKLFKNSFKQKDGLKLALSTFIVLYQMCGSYFTNPICWIIYGLILSDDKIQK